MRTNKDIEGWHLALNRRAGGQSGLSLYLLIELLEREARLTAITIRLVSNGKLSRIQRKCYRNIQRKLFDCWDNVPVNSKTAHAPPGHTPGHLTFLKHFGQIPRYVGSLDGQMPDWLEIQRVSNPPPSS